MKKVLFVGVNVLVFVLIFLLISSNYKFSDFHKNKIVINEIMSSNSKTVLDAYGNYSDWIELYNAGNSEVNLANYYLTDNHNDLTKWRFPRRVIIPAKGHLVIWASGKSKTDSRNELHTNFSISPDGEVISLVAPDGYTVVDQLEKKRLAANVSYGRLPDGTNNYSYFYLDSSTPRAANQSSQKEVQAPYFSKDGGFYQTEFNLSLNSEPSANIYYTLDGSIPTVDSFLYNETILIKSRLGEANELSNIRTSDFEWYGPPLVEVFKGTVVRAIAVKDGKASDVVTHTYFIDENIHTKFQIPVISISTNKENLFDEEIGLFISDNALKKGEEWEREGHIEFYDEKNQLGFSQSIGLRVHGGYTRYAGIKTLRIYARDAKGFFNYQLFPDKEIDIFNSFLLRNGGSSWINVPFRDAFSQSLIKDMTDIDIQYSRPSIVFINGEYWGIYQIRDRYDDDYIYNHYSTSDIDMLSDLGDIVDYGTDEAFFNMLKLLGADLNLGSNYEYVKDKLDVDNFRDYHIAQIYYMNIDQPGKNVKFWRAREQSDVSAQSDGKWRWMLFDTDMGFMYDDFSNYDRNGLVFCTSLEYHGSTNLLSMSDWPTFAPNSVLATYPLRAILKSDEFRISFINRFADLLNTAFDDEVVLKRLEEMKIEINPYMEDHIDRWRLPSNINVWEHDIEEMRTFAKKRPLYMREHIVEYFGLSGTSTITVKSDGSKGYIRIHSIDIKEETPNVTDPSHFSGIYFNDVPITISAIPNDGYRFKRWESNDASINGSEDESLIVTLKDDLTLNAIYELEEHQEKPLENTNEGNMPLVISILVPFSGLFLFVALYFTIQTIKSKTRG